VLVTGRRDRTGELDTLLSDPALLTADGPTEAAPPPLIGGRYQVLALAGTGAMGSVYRVRDTELDEIVALKILRSDLVGSEEMLERFRREVRLTRRIAHRNVARVHDIGEHGRDKYLTMAFIDGEPLRALLARSGALPAARVIAIVRPICHGLAAAHAAGVVHRDLKPDNVMLSADGNVVITDFGVARSALSGDATATLGNSAIGTPAYMAPEQVAGSSELDWRADLYALGVVMFEMLTGQLPFRGGTAIAVAAARLNEQPPDPRTLRPDLDPRLADAVLRSMEQRPDDRWANLDDLLAALRDIEEAPRAGDSSPALAVVEPRRASGFETAASDKTVAVLPFRNAGGADDAYLADGLTEDLIDTLSMARGLRVRPRGATLRFSGGERDVRVIGEELDVQVIVDGSVRRRGEMLRVAARLVSVAEGFQLWARRFDGPAGDALRMSDEVADAVARALTVVPVGQRRPSPTDPGAVDLYLRGRAALRGFGKDAMEVAVDHLEAALDRAPTDATILAVLARAQARLSFFHGDPAFVDGALELAERAVAAAPDQAEAHLALAQVQFARGDSLAAADGVVNAIARSPHLPDAHELLGRIRLEAGPLEAAVAALERALALDPLLQFASLELARACALGGDFTRARALIATADPAVRDTFLVRLAAWSGEPDSWFELLSPSLPLGTSPVDSLLAATVVVIRSREPDPRFAERLLSLAGVSRQDRFRILMLQIAAEYHANFGQVAEALGRIEDAIALGFGDIVWLDHCPLLRDLRAAPGFSPLRQRVDQRAGAVRDRLDRG
jgi:TolB-like protein/Tfp pilus assembly protein PilF